MTTATDFYTNSRQAIETALYGTFATVEAGGREYTFRLWAGEQLPDPLLAYDTETRLIQDREIPQLALATVCGNQGSAYLLHANDIGRFIQQHSQGFYCCHNATFDFWVTVHQLASDPAALASWWAIAGNGRLCCTMLLDQLIRIADIDAEPIPRDLAAVAAEYAGIEIDKSDPYRLRYGELIGLPATAWRDQDSGFWQYACKDPVATLHVMQAQARIARQLLDPYRGELLPGAERRYGPLTACLQTQGAIALDYCTRLGITVDVERAAGLRDDIAAIVEQSMQELEQLAPDLPLFKRYKRGERAGRYKLTASGTAQRDTKAIKQRLLEIAQAAEVPIRPPKLKNGSISDAARYWREYTEAHPFIAAYCRFIEQAKLLQFFAKLEQPQIFPKYRPLVKTGRTSCSDPNLQQLPRDGRFRAMIQAPPGYQLLQIDYAVLELRTLAAICLRRYGRSSLADLFAAGTDPHKHTAAQLLGLTTEQFAELPAAEQKQHRQRAKSLNFGIPGGLGAAALVSYAKHSYAVELTFDEAQQFRDKLIRQIYPELQSYLKDQPWQAIATNLQCTEAAARQAFGQLRQIKVAWAILAGETETKQGDPYTAALIAHIWRVVQQLNRNEQLQAELAAEQPSVELARRVFWGSACTLTGRLRGHVGFTQAANSPFQGLAADGNKLALFRLLRAGFQVCGFVHDEMLILIPKSADYDRAVEQVQQILCDAMAELTPGVPIATEFLLADRWYKGVDDQPRSADGRIIPYTAPAEQAAKPAVKPTVRKPVYDPDTIWAFCPPDETPAAVGSQPKPAKRQLPQPLKWHGGKHYLAQRIIGLMPEHTHYCEPFAGGLSVLLQKDCQGISEAVNDLHGELTTFWQVLADPQQFEQFYRQLECTPLSQPLFEAAAEACNGDPVQQAVQFFIRCRQSRQGLQRDYTTPTRRTRRGMSEQASAWLTAVAGLPQIHSRLKRVEIRNLPAVDFIRKYDHASVVFYADPPYLHATRNTTGEYCHEMTAEQHQQLRDTLASIKGKFLLSGYPSDLYSAWAGQHDYRCEQFEIDNKASSAKQKQIKIECVWLNY